MICGYSPWNIFRPKIARYDVTSYNFFSFEVISCEVFLFGNKQKFLKFYKFPQGSEITLFLNYFIKIILFHTKLPLLLFLGIFLGLFLGIHLRCCICCKILILNVGHTVQFLRLEMQQYNIQC